MLFIHVTCIFFFHILNYHLITPKIISIKHLKKSFFLYFSSALFISLKSPQPNRTLMTRIKFHNNIGMIELIVVLTNPKYTIKPYFIIYKYRNYGSIFYFGHIKKYTHTHTHIYIYIYILFPAKSENPKSRRNYKIHIVDK